MALSDDGAKKGQGSLTGVLNDIRQFLGQCFLWVREETGNPLQKEAADEIPPMSLVIKGLTLDIAGAFSSNVQGSMVAQVSPGEKKQKTESKERCEKV